MLPPGTDPADVTVVMEPTRNAWVALAAWFRRQGARVVLVPPERAADLRAYYAKHTKSDRLDSRLLARLPLLHPDGLHPERGLGPGDAAAPRDEAPLDAGPAPRQVAGPARRPARDPGAWLARGPSAATSPTRPRCGSSPPAMPIPTRSGGSAGPGSARFFARHSRGMWGEAEADELLAAAAETQRPLGGELDYPDLAEDIAIEARLALALTDEIKELDERIAVMLDRRRPGRDHPLRAGRRGRSPARPSSGGSATRPGSRRWRPPGPSPASSRRSTPPARPVATAARRSAAMRSCARRSSSPPTTPGGSTRSLAARYHRLMTEAGKHHTSAHLPHRPDPAHPDHRLLAARRALRPARRRRAGGRSGRGPGDHRRPLHGARRGALPADPSAPPTRNGPPRPGVAKRPIGRPVRPATLSPRGLDIDWELNGSPYVSRAFAAALRRLGIRHTRTRPYRPRTNGKAERCIRTVLSECLYLEVFGSSAQRRLALWRFIGYYNEVRPHLGIGGRTPRQRLSELLAA